jgi:hypothetical protein
MTFIFWGWVRHHQPEQDGIFFLKPRISVPGGNIRGIDISDKPSTWFMFSNILKTVPPL